ncbi:hypothetical protein [Nonomuraea salmonea]|uniref:non-homologous end-joining DNA ligase LigD n=1 Tax=Nonomuraea salmonea TaxID=46181 RepID=UPI002FEA50F0
MADIEVAGREVRITSPDKVVFPRSGHTKLDLVRYYRTVGEAALRGVHGRPMVLKRFVRGIEEEAFFQKRAPAKRPDWIEVAELKIPLGAERRGGRLHRSRAAPVGDQPGLRRSQPPSRTLRRPVTARRAAHRPRPRAGRPVGDVLATAQVAREVLADHGLVAWPKTSGSRGFHVYARIERRWPFSKVRKAAETVAREVERRAPRPGDQPVVEGGAPRGVRRLQPERLRPYGGLRLLRARGRGRPGVHAADLGRGA